MNTYGAKDTGYEDAAGNPLFFGKGQLLDNG